MLVYGDSVPGDAELPAFDSNHPAYVIYTSGSTGKPKGVVVSHASVVSLLANTQPDMNFGPDDVWTQFHSYSFDFAVWELWGALAHGGELLVPDHGLTRSPVDFHRLVRQRGVTVLNQTPSAFYQFIEADRLQLAAACVAARHLRRRGTRPVADARLGRAVRVRPAPSWSTCTASPRPLSTSRTACSTTSDFASGREVSPIGGPIPGLRTYLLDDRLSPVAPGQVGAIYVAGSTAGARATTSGRT